MINSIGIQHNSKVYFNRPVSNHFSSVVSRQNLAPKIAFKGNTDPIVEEANKIIEHHMEFSAYIPTMLTLYPGISECVFVKNIVDMDKEIANVFSIKLNDAETIKFVLEEIKKIPNPILRGICMIPGLGNIAEGVYLMKITKRMGKKFIEQCQKLKEQG